MEPRLIVYSPLGQDDSSVSGVEEPPDEERADGSNVLWHSVIKAVLCATLIVWTGSFLVFVLKVSWVPNPSVLGYFRAQGVVEATFQVAILGCLTFWVMFVCQPPNNRQWFWNCSGRILHYFLTTGLVKMTMDLIALVPVLVGGCGSFLKSQFNTFKRTEVGFFWLERWLKVQDMGSDAWVTFCPEGVWSCPSGGLFWSEDWWWGHISLFILINTFVLMWTLTGRIFVKQIRRKFGISICFSIFAWAIVGPFVILFIDVFLLVGYPCSETRFGWLTNISRVQRFVEALLESPLQLTLQAWIFFQRCFVSHRDEYSFPWALCFSGCTSIATFVVALLEINRDAGVRGMTFFGCLQDLLLVGLERHAPLVHLLPTLSEVIYDDEGPLINEQIAEIIEIARKCPNLTSLSFTRSNALSISAFVQLLECPFRFKIDGATQYRWRFEKDESGATIVMLQGNGAFDVDYAPVDVEKLIVEDGFPFSTYLCAKFEKMHELGSLELLGGNNLGAEGCRELRQLQQLKCLEIGSGNDIGPIGCMQIQKMHWLTSLTIKSSNKIDPVGLAHLRKMVHLRRVTLGRETGVDTADYMKALRQLANSPAGSTNEIGPEELQHTKEEEPHARLIIGAGCKIGELGWKRIKEMNQLRDLTIGDSCEIGHRGCKHIKVLQELTSLTLGKHNAIGIEGCKHIKTLGQLTRLTIWDENEIEAEACEHLAEGLPQLRQLLFLGENKYLRFKEFQRRGVEVEVRVARLKI